jgi:hypothetical protein
MEANDHPSAGPIPASSLTYAGLQPLSAMSD